MDGSFKQYEYTSGMDIQTNVPFDAQSFIDTIKQGATVNEAEGWVQNVNQSAIQSALTNYQNQVKTYVDTAKPDATVGDVLGTKTIVQSSGASLAGVLPYRMLAAGARYQGLPESLRSYLTVRLFSSQMAAALDSPDFSYKISLPKLGYQRFTLSYDPASGADDSVLVAAATDTSSTIPAYLVRVRPVLRIAGEAMATGANVTLGADQTWTLSLQSPNLPGAFASNTVTAGSYTAIVPKWSRVPAVTLVPIRDKMLATQQAISSGQLANVKKDDVTGAMLQLAGLGYWAHEDLIGNIGAVAAKVRKTNIQHLGLFTWDMKIGYYFGLPRSATAGSLMTDIDISRTAAVHESKDDAKAAQYLLQHGLQSSYLEGAHWEQFRDRQLTGKGISATHVISKAAATGVKVFSISAANVGATLPQLGVAQEVKQDIANAVAAGQVVSVPQQNVQIDSWSGTGYAITDPVTGAGAYKISGGFNGGGFDCSCIGFDPEIEAVVGLLLGVVAAFVPSVAVALAILAIAVSIVSLLGTICQINEGNACNEAALEYAIYLFSGIGILLGIIGLLSVPPLLILAGVYLPIVAGFAAALITTDFFRQLTCPSFPT